MTHARAAVSEVERERGGRHKGRRRQDGWLLLTRRSGKGAARTRPEDGHLGQALCAGQPDGGPLPVRPADRLHGKRLLLGFRERNVASARARHLLDGCRLCVDGCLNSQNALDTVAPPTIHAPNPSADAGGFSPNPSYEECCSGRTGHTEAVQIVFDPAKIAFVDILRWFWEGAIKPARAPAQRRAD